MPDYSEMVLSEERPEIDVSEQYQEIRGLGKHDIVGYVRMGLEFQQRLHNICGD